LKCSVKKLKIYLLGINTDPDRYALDAGPDPDPAKWCGSHPIWIRIHNTEFDKKLILARSNNG
jgi:hypothetical protein